MNVFWIAGENTSPDPTKGHEWRVVGVFDSEQKAIDAGSYSPRCFVAPLELNKAFPEGEQAWEGAYYPSEDKK